jgi:dienelactone hydrolase
MGLLTMMQPVSDAPAGAYFWAGTRPMRFALIVRAGSRKLGSGTFTRRFSATSLTIRSESLRRAGLIGRFVYPTGAKRRPAVIVLGGSEGGVPGPLASDPLAAHGYPVLALGYFKLRGLPQQLRRVPLEYFEQALAWLRRQPQIDPQRIAVLGVSRGSEAALLSGAYFPRLVNAVIGLSPSDAAICSFPGCVGPAWIFHGRPVPFTSQFGNPYPTDHPAAVIPVQRIRGPLFLGCGTADAIWPSCSYSRVIMRHLNAAHDRFPHVLYSYVGAGHSVASFIPYEPTDAGLFSDDHPEVDQQAVARDWPRLLAFLAAWGGSG